MNILAICHYGLYKNLSYSFIHNQAKEFVTSGNNVRVIIPIAIGKRDFEGKRFSKLVKVRVVDGVEIFYLRYLSLSKYGSKFFNLKSVKTFSKLTIKKLLADFNPQIIHAHTIGFDGSLALYFKRKLSIPVVITSHGSDTTIPILEGKGYLIKKICDKADGIVTVSNKLKERLYSSGTVTPINVIYNGYSKAYLKNNIAKEKRSIIQVGNLTKQKNFDKTIIAFSEIKRDYPNSILKIIGSGEEEHNLKKLCNRLNVLDSVSFFGQLDNKNVFNEMMKSEIFIMPSENEGFGIVYLEAMACGCVTIGTEGEGISEIITSGKNGFLINPNKLETISETIKHCFGNDKMMIQISKSGKESVKELAWSDNCKEYEKIFKKCLKHTGEQI